MGSYRDHIEKYNPGKYERCLKRSEQLKEKFLNLLYEGKGILLYKVSSGWYGEKDAKIRLRLWRENNSILYTINRKASVVLNQNENFLHRRSEDRWGSCTGKVYSIDMNEYPNHEVLNIQLFKHGFSESTDNGVKIASRFDFHLAEAFRFKKDSFYKMKCFPDKETMDLYYEVMKEELI